MRTFIFFAALTILLFLLALIFPRQGISISPGIHLKFMNLADLSASDTLDMDQVVEQIVAASTVTEDPEEGFYPDGLQVPTSDTVIQVFNPANADSLKQSVYPIRFAQGEPHLLDPFFSQLDGLLDGSVARTRILHFGDSQIENDRMTALIRYRLQKQFGGSGTGLVQAIPLYSGHMAFQQEVSGEWLRYTFSETGIPPSPTMHTGSWGHFRRFPCPKRESGPVFITVSILRGVPVHLTGSGCFSTPMCRMPPLHLW